MPWYSDDTVTLHHGDALDVLRTLPDGSVNCVVTSPPYYALRDYGVDGQIGLEPTPDAYVARLVELFAEVRRALRKDGTVWLNLGDSYAHKGTGQQGRSGDRATRAYTAEGMPGYGGIPEKNLLGTPWRVALALQADGWILRADVIWSKRNFMPESVRDRPTRSHEYVFLLVKSQRYIYDCEAIREDSDPVQEAHNRRYAREYAAHSGRAANTGQPGNVNNVGIHSRPGTGGRNTRSVWWISSQPYPGAHFAVMPPELARRCVLAGCPEGGTVLDPFCGSGTTGLAAERLGRRFVGIDLNEQYLQLALKRLSDRAIPFDEGVA